MGLTQASLAKLACVSSWKFFILSIEKSQATEI